MATKRNYLTSTELNAYLGITATDAEIERAEELIDAWVGFQERFLHRTVRGEVTNSATNKIIDDQGGLYITDDYFKGAELEIIGGTGLGEIRKITASSRDEKSITYDGANIAVDTTTVFVLRQVGKFPRHKDAYTNRDGLKWYKTIPEAVKHAVACQVEYMAQLGDGFFNTDQSDKMAERIGNYSYSKGGGGNSGAMPSSLSRMIAPKARTLLRGIRNPGGRLVPEKTSWQ